MFIESFFARKFYPKTTVPISSHPEAGARSVSDGFRWAERFLQRLFKKFGANEVLHAMFRWKWDVTTCFSGIGCPETALPLDLVKRKHMMFFFETEIPSPDPCHGPLACQGFDLIANG